MEISISILLYPDFNVTLNLSDTYKRDPPVCPHRQSILDGVPPSLPALLKAYRVQQKVSRVGFDWDDIAPVFEKLNEEIAELKDETIIENNQERITDEMGDILFASVNLSRHLGVNPEQALRDSNRKFISPQIQRFYDPTRRTGQNCHRYSQNYVEDDLSSTAAPDTKQTI